MQGDKRREVVYLPNLALFSVLVTIATFFFAVYSWMADLDQIKQTVCLGLSIAAAIFLFTVGRKSLSGHWPLHPGQQIGLTSFQIVWVSILVIGGGLVHAWMLN